MRRLCLIVAALVLFGPGPRAAARAAQDPRLEAARAALSAGEELREKGDRDSVSRAIAKYEEALGIWRALGERSWEAATLNGLALAHQKANRHEEALEYFEAAIAIAHATRTPLNEANTLMNLGALYLEMDRVHEALGAFERALPLFRATLDRIGEASACQEIGNIYASLGDDRNAADARSVAHGALARSGALRVSGGVLAGMAIARPQPSYPRDAMSAGIQGQVVVVVTVGEDGAVISATAVSGHPTLHRAAVDAAYGWRFTPTTQSGIPVKVIGTISFNFRKN